MRHLLEYLGGGSPSFLILGELPLVMRLGLHPSDIFSRPEPPEDHLVHCGETEPRELAQLLERVHHLGIVGQGPITEIDNPSHLLQAVVAVDSHFLVLRLLVHGGMAGTTFALEVVQELGESVLVSPLGRPGHEVSGWLEVGVAQLALLGVGVGGGVGIDCATFLLLLGVVPRGGVGV